MAAVILTPASAQAQSQRCLQLINQLAAIDSGGGFQASSPKYRQYERAVRDQRAQIAKTERASRQNGCTGFGIFSRNTALCGRIRSSLDQMNGNLAQLERTLRQLSPRGGSNSVERNAVMAELSANRCEVRGDGNRQIIVNAEPPRRRSLLEQIFGVRTFRNDGRGLGNEYDPDAALSARYGTFRTLCVRSCDGYYFPISFSTIPDRFPDDEATCRAMCPGTSVELYFHRMPTQDSEDMISYRTDQPYASTPNAFSYRKEFNPECGCRRAGSGLTEVAGSGGFADVAPAAQDEGPRIGTPVWRVDNGLDPDTLANSGGMLDTADIEAMVRSQNRSAPVAKSDGQKTVRIVGPSFFPVQ